MNGTRLLVPCLLVVAPAPAQLVVHQPWPTVPAFAAGHFQRAAAGRFIENHPGRTLAIVRDGKVFFALDPAHVAAFEEVGPPGIAVHALARVPATVPGGTDRLAALTNAGLAILTAAGSSPDLQAGAPLATWTACRSLASRSWSSGGAVFHLLAASDVNQPGAVRVAMSDGSTSAPVEVGAWAAGAHVLNLAFVDWIPGSTPELAVLTASGLVVLTAQGSTLTAWPQSLTAGRLAAVPRAPAGEDVLSVVQLASWQLVRHTPAGATPCGVLPIAPSALVPGLATGLLDGDEHPDLLVSTDGITRVVVLAPDGTFVPAQAVLLHDAHPASGAIGANACAAVLDDIDSNGEIDAVAPARTTIGSTTTDQVIVWPNVADAVRVAQGQNTELPAPPVFAVAQAGTTGFWACLADPWATQPAHEKAIGMRLVVPASTSGGTADRMSIVLWQLDPDLVAPVDMQPLLHLWWTLPANQTTRDVYVPFPGDGTHFLLELRRVAMDAGSTAVVAAEASTWFSVVVANAGATWAEIVEPLLGPIPSPVPADWLAVEAGGGPSDPVPAAAVTGPGGDRFVGAILPAPPKLPTKPKKSAPPPVPGPNPPQ